MRDQHTYSIGAYLLASLAFLAFSISLALVSAPCEISLCFALISLCRRSRMGRTVPLSVLSVSVLELTKAFDCIVNLVPLRWWRVQATSPCIDWP
ncbi:hypothetical protein F5B18DRAFT_376657 [Nemania serpens]|nr:hypothetical protein F5B18DRAFT_376657 [Nemania serpens]